MDSQRFDDLARRLGRGASRRGVLKGIVAGAGASVFGLSLRQTTRAGVAMEDCTTDEECGDGFICDEGSCVPEVICGGEGTECEGDGSCCAELVCVEGACAPAPPVCAAYGEECSFPEVTVAASVDGSNCCEGQCLEGICVPFCIGDGGDCAGDDDCCDGLICSEGSCLTAGICGGFGAPCEMVEDHGCCQGLTCFEGQCDNPSGFCGVPGDDCEAPDHHCCNGLTCFEGQCDNPSGLCMDKGEYCDGEYYLCCDGLVCGEDYYCHAAGKPEEPQKPKPQAPVVTTLPSTGSGDGESDSAWLNAAALGGAAAVIGGALLRKKDAETASEG